MQKPPLTKTLPSSSNAERPLELADGVELIGEFKESGYKDPPSIVRLGNGQTVQLTELLFVVLSCIDGRRDFDELADAVSQRYGKTAAADDVRFLVEEKLRPLGLLKDEAGNNPPSKKADPLLGIKGRFTLANERVTNTVTAPFQVLFFPPVLAAVVAGFVGALWWLFFAEGLAQGTRELLYSPGMLVLTFALTALSAGFHEFGHAAACRYGGARPGVIGGGVYLVWPVFFTDVTDSYRLGRAARLRTDLGGLYFNTIFSLATVGVWALTDYDPLLVLVPLQLLQMTQQLMPFVRFDGYYILADLTGVPDLFARIKPTLQAAVPGREASDSVTALKPWVRIVVTAWVIAVVPILLVSLALAVFGLPRLLATVWDSVGRQWGGVTNALGDGEILGVLAGLLATAAVLLPALSILFILGRLVKRIARSLWQRTEDRPGLRATLLPLGAAAAAGLAWLWWPNGEYEPLRKGERWTVQETVANIRHVPTGRPGLTREREATLDTPASTTTTVVARTTTTLDRDEDERTDTTSARVGTDDTDDSTSDEPSPTTTETTAP